MKRLSIAQIAELELARSVAAQKRLAPSVARARRIAARVERQHRLPDGGRLPFGEVSTTLAVATLELSGLAGSSRSIPAENGVYAVLCGHGARRHCALGARVRPTDALVARRQALAFAALVFGETPVDLVVVALPQSATEYILLVFQRDLLDAGEPDVGRDTRDRFFAMTGLAAIGLSDSLLLAQLPSASTLGR